MCQILERVKMNQLISIKLGHLFSLMFLALIISYAVGYYFGVQDTKEKIKELISKILDIEE